MDVEVITVVLLMLLSAIGGSYFQKRSFSRNARMLAYYQETYLRKQGSAMGFGQYELLSFDGGKQWYATVRGRNGEVIIRGVAEEIFPGLVSRLDGMDTLVAHVIENGPVTLSGERAATDRALLESAGFTVQERK